MPEVIAVELATYSADWAKSAAQEAARIKDAIGGVVVIVHHIGSTSIPGIRAKPILDLMPLVSSLAELDAARAKLESLGYEWFGEYGIPGRRYCKRDDSKTGKRLVQLHFFEAQSPEVMRHLAFRDYLRMHPDMARAYEAEKLRAQRRHPSNSHAYSDAKSAWIVTIQEIAITWAHEQGQAR
jgi:GrpB-like predicted nucleotidyltransferase (UPF0157 family)